MYLLRRPQTDMATEHLWALSVETEPQRGLGSDSLCSKITKVTYLFTEKFPQARV